MCTLGYWVQSGRVKMFTDAVGLFGVFVVLAYIAFPVIMLMTLWRSMKAHEAIASHLETLADAVSRRGLDA